MRGLWSACIKTNYKDVWYFADTEKELDEYLSRRWVEGKIISRRFIPYDPPVSKPIEPKDCRP